MRYTALVASLLGMFCSLAASADVPPPVFYLPLDGSTVAPVAGGSGEPIRRVTGDADTILCAVEQAGWRNRTTPGLLAAKTIGAGRVVACGLDPDALGQTRGRVKALRLWNLLLTNLAVERNSLRISTPTQAYEDNEWEHVPPYMNW